jgi:hypothetical protein
MNLLRAKYETERGLRRGDKSHINDKGLPLCRAAYRNQYRTAGAADTTVCQWIPEIGVGPSCPVCAARIRKMGGAA